MVNVKLPGLARASYSNRKNPSNHPWLTRLSAAPAAIASVHALRKLLKSLLTD